MRALWVEFRVRTRLGKSPRPQNARSRLAGSILGPQAHICAFFKNPADEYQVLLPFIKEGLAGRGPSTGLTRVELEIIFGGYRQPGLMLRGCAAATSNSVIGPTHTWLMVTSIRKGLWLCSRRS
jgi:hypothetical protein